MIGYLGLVTWVGADQRTATVSFPLMQIPSRTLRVAHPFGLVAGPRLGDEVLVIPTGTGLDEAVIVGWLPGANEVDGDKVVVTTTGSTPTDMGDAAGTPVGGGAVAPVKARM